MQLDKVSIVLRPRQGWEAVDLGFRMTAHWARAVWPVWLAVYVPTALALALAFREWPWVAALMLWWLKPVFDRWVLHVLSRAVFGQVPRLAETLGAWREVLSPGMLGSLVSRLWDYARSFTLPVTQLERQTGAPARARRRLLKQRAGAHALGLTMVCSVFEAIVLYGIYSFSQLFATDVQWSHHAQTMPGLDDLANWWTWKDTLAYALAVSVIEPFYVGGGFALYLNRRVMLEGWDVEVALRRMSQRFAAQNEAAVGTLGVLLMAGLMCVAALHPTAAVAQPGPASFQSASVVAAPDAGTNDDDTSDDDDDENEATPSKPKPVDEKAKAAADKNDIEMCPAPYQPRDTQAHRQIRAILADATFGSERREMQWQKIKSDEPRSDRPELKKANDELGGMLNVMGQFLRVIAWLVLAAVIVALVWMIARQWQQRTPRDEKDAAPTQLFGLAISPESLPSDVPSAARALLQAGQVREALSLLYRGALSYLVHVRGLVIRRGATEGDVLILAQRQLQAGPAGYFEQLMPVWVEAAYAARLPSAERVDALCDQHAASMPRETAADVEARKV
jgi:hypothetical protein